MTPTIAHDVSRDPRLLPRSDFRHCGIPPCCTLCAVRLLPHATARDSIRRVTFEVRPERAADREAVRRVITAAFGQDDPAHGDDVAHIWESLGHHRRAGLVAEEGGTVVGHVGLSLAWVDARRELVEAWMLSPLGVLPERQRAGLGTALVAAAVETARGSGVPALFLEGSPHFYGARASSVPTGTASCPRRWSGRHVRPSRSWCSSRTNRG